MLSVLTSSIAMIEGDGPVLIAAPRQRVAPVGEVENLDEVSIPQGLQSSEVSPSINRRGSAMSIDHLIRDKFCSFGEITYQFYEPLMCGTLQVSIWQIRRPPQPSINGTRLGFARDVETFSFSFYENGEILDISRDPRFALLRALLGQNARRLTASNYEMTPKEAEQVLAALQLFLAAVKEDN